MKCQLCQKDKSLKNSHIFPKFFYFPLVVKNKGQSLLVNDDQERINKQIGDGTKEKLLCECCENKIGIYETYIKRTFYKNSPRKTLPVDHWNISENSITFKDIDFQKLKLFQMSVLWRAAITSKDQFSEVSLDANQKERLRELIYSEKIGELTEFPCLLTAVTFQSEFKPGFMHAVPFEIDLHTGYHFIFGALRWTFILNKLNKKDDLIQAFRFVERENKLSIPIIELEQDAFAMQGLERVYKSKKLPIYENDILIKFDSRDVPKKP